MKTFRHIFIFLGLLHGVLAADNVRSKLVFDGEFTSAWHHRKDGTTAILYTGKVKWESKDDFGKVWGDLNLKSHQISVEPQKDTEYRLYYSNSDIPLIMKPSNIASILQEAMQRRITDAYALEPVIKINENGHINLSASVFVFYTSLKREGKGVGSIEPKKKLIDEPNENNDHVMVRIAGQVNKTGGYKLPKNASSKDILAACSGATPFGSIQRVEVFSKKDGSKRLIYDFRKDIILSLKDGDIIIIPQKRYIGK